MEQLIIISLSIAIMVSPDTLALLGNFYGETGAIGGFILLGFMLLYIFLALQYPIPKISSAYSDYQITDDNIRKTDSNVLFHVIQMVVKIPVLLFLATGLLVSSGFVFNEVFIFWFPNFGFAFLLLLMILCLQWMKSSFRLYIQLAAASVVIIGLLILTVKGLIEIDFTNLIRESNTNLNSVNIKTFFLPLLLFIGFDLGINSIGSKNMSLKRSIPFAIFLIGILYIIWGWNMTAFLSDQKLIHSSIPHILTAKKIWGQTGRYIMGGIIIGGTIAGVNGLFIYISTQFKNLTINQKNFNNLLLSKYVATVLALIIGIFMAGGLAGSDRLEYLIRGALILWLISYSILPLMFNKDGNYSHRKMETSSNANVIKKLFIFILPLIGSAILITTDGNFPLLMKQILFQTLGITILVSILFIAINRNHV